MVKKFYQQSPAERVAALNLSDAAKANFLADQSTARQSLIENYVTDYPLPEGIVKELLVGGRSYQVPMVTEEPSVVAAANNGARLLNLGGGVRVLAAGEPLLGGQLLFTAVSATDLTAFVAAKRSAIDAAAQAAKPSLYQRGGGLRDVAVRALPGRRAVVTLTVATGQAMGANAVNTILEAVAPIFQPFEEQLLAKILTNAGHDSLLTVQGRVSVTALGGVDRAKQIAALSAFGAVDPDRAVTENKGLFNGIAAVLLATGNDFRAVEAAGHAYAARHGRYQSLTSWQLTAQEDFLEGELTLPMNIGLVGGALASLSRAQENLALLDVQDVQELKQVILALGLAQNLAALKAITGPGIQAGHMKMQARVLAQEAGASEAEIPAVVARLQELGDYSQAKAQQVLGEIRTSWTQN
ncbi:hydroxymethylglutaryl-CoA reductase, degradative [Leuconostocaceae bacterium ESL0958]|nr:hydroxymethylglutaryl-CoA reductase, degradative [Leuconostocaceae bacterium ESL0958]